MKQTFRDRIARFMYGRRGYDELSRALWISSLVIFVANLFCELLALTIIESVLVIYTLFRMLSKNLERRRAENAVYHRIVGKVKKFFALLGNRWRDRKTHAYKKCPTCKNTLRFPRMKGKHVVSCPCCRRRFDVIIR